MGKGWRETDVGARKRRDNVGRGGEQLRGKWGGLVWGEVERHESGVMGMGVMLTEFRKSKNGAVSVYQQATKKLKKKPT